MTGRYHAGRRVELLGLEAFRGCSCTGAGKLRYTRLMKKLASGLVALTALALPATAHASYHLMKVVEVCGGTTAQPNAQYVQLQMFSSGQNSVSTHKVTIFDAAGTLVQTSTFASGVSDGNAQATILIGTAEVETAFGVIPNLVMATPAIVRAGGKACFDAQPEDCVAWGNYTGPATGVGTPLSSGAGIPLGQAAKRKLDIAGGATTLEAADDTDVSADDFVLGTPAPVRNGPPPADAGAADAGSDAAAKSDGSVGTDSGSAFDAGTISGKDASTAPPTPDSGSGAKSDAASGAAAPAEYDDSGCSIHARDHGGAEAFVGVGVMALLFLERRRRRCR